MSKQVILVTGCRSGIGLAIALESARAGHVVYAGLRDLSTDAELKEAAADLSIRSIQLDITNSEERNAAVELILREQGRIDVLINNAGIGIGGFLEELEEDELRSVLDVNVIGTWAMTKACLPAMREAQKGLIVMISSLSGRMAIPGIGAYCTAKFALEGMSETWRHELASFGVDVILIQPGAYRTDMIGAKRRIGRAASTDSGPYAELSEHMMEWYDRVVVGKAEDPAHLAQRLVSLFDCSGLRLRHPIGPSTVLRSLALRFLPFGAMELVFKRVLRGQTAKRIK